LPKRWALNVVPVVKMAFVAGADECVPLPEYQSPGAAGADIRANLEVSAREKGVVLSAGARALIATGICLEIPPGYEAQIRPRSGLALKHGITLANAPGTIDSDYRGPLGIILVNLGHAPFVVAHGARIAQMIVAPVAQAEFVQVTELDGTARGSGGFGSTGVG